MPRHAPGCVLGYQVHETSTVAARLEACYALYPDGRVRTSGVRPYSDEFGDPAGWADCPSVPAEAEFIGNYRAGDL